MRQGVSLLIHVYDAENQFFAHTTMSAGFNFDSKQPLDPLLDEQVSAFLQISKLQNPSQNFDTSVDSYRFFSWDVEPLSPGMLFSEVPQPRIVLAVRGGEAKEQAVRIRVYLEALPEPKKAIDEWLAQVERSDQTRTDASVPKGRPPRVFICYEKGDAERTREIYDYLSDLGADPWRDKEKLVIGDNWEVEIQKAVRDADAFVVCFSSAFDKVGFRQQEVRWAMEALRLRPPDRGFVIPFMLAPCELPDWCQPFHAGGDLTRPTTHDELRRAVEKHCRVTFPK